MPVDPIERLAADARRRSQQMLQTAQGAIAVMAASGDAITVASLARNAQVSRSWIYTQPELRERIEQLRQAAPARPTRSAAASRASLESLKNRLHLAHQRIGQLREENQQLRREVEHTCTGSSATADRHKVARQRHSSTRCPCNAAHRKQKVEITATLLDRLLHRSVVLDIAGDSYRLRDHHARADKMRADTHPGTLH